MAWLNVIIQGSLLGGIYALFAIGLSLSFGIMRLVNIAHGDLIVLSAYVALVIVDGTGLDPISALVIVVPIMFVLGYALQRGLLNFTLSGGLLPPLLVTRHLGHRAELTVADLGAYTHRQQGAIETASVLLPGGISIGVYPLLVFAVAVLAIGSLQFCSQHAGQAFRAAPTTPTRPVDGHRQLAHARWRWVRNGFTAVAGVLTHPPFVGAGLDRLILAEAVHRRASSMGR
jgi:branched-chain amino acid transport system permease protein